jgi:2-C-methyl-D-erythritol 2,4-cyclodiphosphate synthase
MIRVGIGYDVHKLVRGRRLMLGGVHIPYAAGLQGHSDADVIIHAICDALLGAAALGDIGTHFPNSDPRYKGIHSLKLLEKIQDILRREKHVIINIDAVLLAEEPTIAPHTDRMKKLISHALKIKSDQISIKATTNEGLGFVGQKKGMAAYAVGVIERAVL